MRPKYGLNSYQIGLKYVQMRLKYGLKTIEKTKIWLNEINETKIWSNKTQIWTKNDQTRLKWEQIWIGND